MSKRDLLVELGYEDSIVFESPDYDNAIIGTDNNSRVVYDYDKMVEYLNERFCLDTDEKVKEVTDKCVQWIRNWFEKNGKGCNAVIGMSGGKDSTIVAALCCKALGPDRVIGVSMPDDGQGINGAEEICKHLGIKYMCVPIYGITGAFDFSFNLGDGKNVMSEQTKQNIPPRVRMTMLYAIAQSMNGRVANTCNLSEDYIGYSTLFGDSAGSFAPIAQFTVTELKKIGRYLEIPIEWVDKTPDDGLPNSKPDEEKFGFTYSTLDIYIRGGIIDETTARKIEEMHKNNKFKTDIIRIPYFNPYE